MTLSLALIQVGLRIGRWILPLVAVVFVSATLAFAAHETMAGDSAGDQQRDVQVAVSTGGEASGPTAVERWTTSPSAQSADLGPLVTPERCAPIGSGYMDSSIVVEMRKIECGWAA